MNGSSSKKQLKTSYRASPQSIRPLYTGGPVLLSRDGKWLFTTMDEEVLVTEVETGQAVGHVKGDGSAITSLAISYHSTPPSLLTFHLSTTMRWYTLPSSPPSTSASAPGGPTNEKGENLKYTRQNVKSHGAPVLVSSISPDHTLIATGSSDGIVKVWDLAGGYTTHLFRGHGGPVSALRFRYLGERMELWTGSTDGKVRIFDLKASGSGGGGAKAMAVLEGHVSVVRGIDFTADGKYAVTTGRDRVVLVWDISDLPAGGGEGKVGKGKKKEGGPRVVQTIIAGELIESVGILPQEAASRWGNGALCWTGGEKGVVRIWDTRTAKQVGSMEGVEGVDEVEVDEDDPRGILDVLYDPSTSSLVSIHADQNIIYHSLSTGLPTRQIVGFNDEIVDATFLSPTSGDGHTHLALAANSNLIRIYTLDKLDARLLSGHRDMVLCLDRCRDFRYLVSGSKDHTARIWAPTAGPEGHYRCVAVCEGHAESIGAVAFGRTASPPTFLCTASQDRTIKLWDLRDLPSTAPEEGTPAKPRSLATLRAHEKDINSLDVAPNDRFLASGSQDKTVKIFSIDMASGALKLLGTCNGHRRGVWSVKFSRTDKIVASGAADRTVRLWSLDDFTCLKTFEGHTNSVLRVDFLSSGMQLITSGGDGLVKLWNIRDEECIKTLDNHEDKIWALAISSDERTIVSAGADSVATLWQDSSEAEQAEKNEAIVAQVQSEQDFTNYLAMKDYKRAIQLALGMGQPGRLLSLFRTISGAGTGQAGGYTGSPEIDTIITHLSPLDLTRLLKFVRDWNANARTSNTAQSVLHAILRLKTPDEIIGAFSKSQRLVPEPGEDGGDGDGDVNMANGEAGQRPRKKGEAVLGLREILDGLIPYSERHFARMDKLVQESYMLDYVVGEMDGGLWGGEVMQVDGSDRVGVEGEKGMNGH